MRTSQQNLLCESHDDDDDDGARQNRLKEKEIVRKNAEEANEWCGFNIPESFAEILFILYI